MTLFCLSRNFIQKNKLPEDFLLFTGVLDPRKNLTGLIKALSVLKKERKDCPDLVIAGIPAKEWTMSNQYKKAAQFNLLRHIHVIGILEKDILYIKKITVNEGPPFKRWRPGSRGRANPITKKTSHINLVLDVKPGVKVEKKKAKKPEPETIQPEKIEKAEEEKREKPKYRAPKKIVKKPETRGLFKKIFRRKSF